MYKTQTKWCVVLQLALLPLTAKMVRFLGIASLLLFSHIALVATEARMDSAEANGVEMPHCVDPKASKSYDMHLSKRSCSPFAQRNARTTRAAAQELIVAIARTVDVRAWIQ